MESYCQPLSGLEDSVHLTECAMQHPVIVLERFLLLRIDRALLIEVLVEPEPRGPHRSEFHVLNSAAVRWVSEDVINRLVGDQAEAKSRLASEPDICPSVGDVLKVSCLPVVCDDLHPFFFALEHVIHVPLEVLPNILLK